MAYDISEMIALAGDLPPQVEVTAPMVPGLALHIDGDYLAYYASGNVERSAGEARQEVHNLVEKFRAAAGAEHIVVHTTASGCQKGERYLIATVKKYQAQRVGQEKPKNQPMLQEYIQTYDGEHFKVKNWKTREADDGVAACAHFAIGKSPGYIAMAYADKDFRMIPGLHITWLGQQRIFVKPGEYDAHVCEKGKQYGLKWFWLQMLHGDAADHIPGLEGYVAENKQKGRFFKPIGEKTAEKFLEHCTNGAQACEVVAGLYKEYYDERGGNWADRFCEQAALLWMRCGNDAHICDFYRHAGHSKISHHFCDDLIAAVQRLEERIASARAEIDQFANQAN